VTEGVVNMDAADSEALTEIQIPGTCYTKLLHHLPGSVLSGMYTVLSAQLATV